MIQIKKTLLTLVALLAVTTGAWAQTPELLVTIESKGNGTSSQTFDGKAILTFGGGKVANDNDNWGWYNFTASEEITLTVTGADGYTVTSCTFYTNSSSTTVEGEHPTVYVTGGPSQTYTATGKGGNSLGLYGITKIEVYGAASSSGPEVAWTAASKTGTFTMPGDNVTVSVEYYDLATLADKGLTAAEDAAAKTEAPLAVLAENAITGGTVMYYVAPDANFSQADAIALPETAWSADIPTAETIEAEGGTCYVWYYIKGDDEHSDTDPQRLAVTVLPEPTYAVELAEGTEESDKWTVKAGTDGSFQSLPLKGVKAGTKVKLKYDGDRSMLKGVKAVKKAAAGIVNPVVGQVIGSDGKNYDANATLPDGVTAVAVIAYVGSETGDDTYKNGLAIALADESNSNWSTAKSTCEGKSAVSGAAWLLPSQKQWKTMFKANGGNEGSYSGLNTAIGTAGGTALQVNERYWSSSELDADFAWVLVLGENSAGWDGAPEDLGHQVRACLAF